MISKFISIVFTGFSWTNWTQSLDTNRESIAVGLLFEELGIAKFLLESMCNRETAPYTPSTEGWNASKKLIIIFLQFLSKINDHLLYWLIIILISVIYWSKFKLNIKKVTISERIHLFADHWKRKIKFAYILTKNFRETDSTTLSHAIQYSFTLDSQILNFKIQHDCRNMLTQK